MIQQANPKVSTSDGDGHLTKHKSNNTASDRLTSNNCKVNLRRVSGGLYAPIEHIVFKSLEVLLGICAVTKRYKKKNSQAEPV